MDSVILRSLEDGDTKTARRQRIRYNEPYSTFTRIHSIANNEKDLEINDPNLYVTTEQSNGDSFITNFFS